MTKKENKKEGEVSELAEDFLIELGLNKSEIQHEKFLKKKKLLVASEPSVKIQDIKEVLTQKPLIIERQTTIRKLKEENRQLKDEIDNLKDKIKQLKKFSEDIKLKDQIIKKIKDKHKNITLISRIYVKNY